MNIIASQRGWVFGCNQYRGNPITLHRLENPSSLPNKVDGAFSYDQAYYWPLQDGVYGVHWVSRHGVFWFCGHGALALTDHLLRSEGLDSLTLKSSSYELHGYKDHKHSWVSLPPLERGEEGYPLPDFLHKHLKPYYSAYYPQAATLHLQLQDSRQLAVFDRKLLGQHANLHPPAEALILSAVQGQSYSYRYLLPYEPKAEDPATGSAHIYLAPYYHKLLGHQRFACKQLAPGGGGELSVYLQDERVYIGGAVRFD